MSAWGDRWKRGPAWLQAAIWLVVVLVLLGVGAAVAKAASDVHPVLGIAGWLVLLGLALVPLIIGVRTAQRELGSREQYRLLRNALMTGRLPDDADPTTWRPMLAKFLENQSVDRWFLAMLAALVLGLNVASLATLDDPSVSTVLVVIVSALVVAAGLAGFPYLIRRRRLRNARAFLADPRLREAATDDPA